MARPRHAPAGRYWPEFCAHIDRKDLITDERFATTEFLIAHTAEAAEIVADVLASRTLADWTAAFAGMEGQWAVAQDPWEVGQDPALRANGLIAEVVDSDGAARELVASPVQFNEKPTQITRAPGFAEHTDEILRSLGKSDDETDRPQDQWCGDLTESGWLSAFRGRAQDRRRAERPQVIDTGRPSTGQHRRVRSCQQQFLKQCGLRG